MIEAELLSQLYSAGGLDIYVANVLEVLPRLIPSEITSYNEVDPRRSRVVWQVEPAGAEFAGAREAFEAHMGEHPLIAHYHRTGDPRALRLSDFASLRQLRGLGIYQECYRRLGVDRQLAVTVPGRRGLVVGITVNRRGRDFTAAEQVRLDRLRPHLVRAHANAAAYELLAVEARTLAARLEALEELGVRGAEDALRGRHPCLTPREADVLALVAEGGTNRQVARQLGISPATVRTHLENAFPKLGVATRTAAAAVVRGGPVAPT